jgi:anti-anti-sigma regulatory factor
MMTVRADKIGDLVIVECEGLLVRSEAAFTLRNAVISQKDSHTVVLDMSQLEALEGGGLGMLSFLQRWAYDNNIRLKLFNLQGAVLHKLERSGLLPTFELATPEEITELLTYAQHRSCTPSASSQAVH